MKNHIACFYDLSPPQKKDVVNPQVTAATCPHLPGHIHIIHHMPKLKGAKGTAKHSKIRSAIKSNHFQSICCLLVIPQNINLENPFPQKKNERPNLAAKPTGVSPERQAQLSSDSELLLVVEPSSTTEDKDRDALSSKRWTWP